MSARDEPPHFRHRDRGGDRARSRSPRRGGREERERDRGYAQMKREPDEGYGAREREQERSGDRRRYDEDAVGLPWRGGADEQEEAPKSPPKPNFANSGLLAKESNQVKGVALKYHEPPEARKPTQNWRLYVFKGDEQVGKSPSRRGAGSAGMSIDPDLFHIYRQSCFLVGRDAVVADIHVAHPSCSKQHAVLQFRAVSRRNQYGDVVSEVNPFIIDLDSTNHTYVNGQEVPKSRYFELRLHDGEWDRLWGARRLTPVLKFGTSAREYVLLHEDAGK